MSLIPRRINLASRTSSSRQLYVSSRAPSLHTRQSLGRTIDQLQVLALERPNLVPLIERFVQALLTDHRAKRGDPNAGKDD